MPPLVAIALGLALALGVGFPALAHGGRTLVVEPAVAAPGAALSVHGSYLWSDQPVTIVLLAIDGTMWTLGDSATGGNGDLESKVVLPEGLPDATYSILARADNGEDAHVELVIRSESRSVPIPAALGAAVIGLVAVLGAAAVRRRNVQRTA